jgi:hypothetical protein
MFRSCFSWLCIKTLTVTIVGTAIGSYAFMLGGDVVVRRQHYPAAQDDANQQNR